MDTKEHGMKTSTVAAIVGISSVLLMTPSSLTACGSPLILDLNGDGLETSSLSWPVRFDIDGDGVLEETAWTLPSSQDGFLWVDLNHNGRVDGGQELFGDHTILPDGTRAEHGFQALAAYDSPELGGNGDGELTREDAVWTSLRIWVDDDHDGRSRPREVRPLGAFQIRALSLRFQEILALDEALNVHRYQGSFTRAVRPVLEVRPPGDRPALQRVHAMNDVFFNTRELAPKQASGKDRGASGAALE
jgi:hypothetical protein